MAPLFILRDWPAREKGLDKLDPSRKAARQVRKAEAAKLREERERALAAAAKSPGPAGGGGKPGEGLGQGAGGGGGEVARGFDSPATGSSLSPFGSIGVASLTVSQLNEELKW